MSEHRPFAALCRAEATLAATGSGEADWKSAAVALEALRARRGEPAAAEWPWLPRAWVLGAEAAVRLKQYDVVERLAKELTEQGTAGAYVYQIDEVLGRAYQRQARFDEARAAFERVTGEKLAYRTETAAKAQFLLAETYFLQERWADAFLAYQRVYTSYSYPEWQAAALLQSAKCDEQQGQWPEAVRSYDQLLKEFPQSTHATEASERVPLARQKAGG
jgi:tetratricopeptide (TPR) repeat protein